jgi:hypothetical protein
MRPILLALLLPLLACAEPNPDADSPKDLYPDSKPKLRHSTKSADNLPASDTQDPTTRALYEFSGDPIDVVIRTLARQAKMNIVLAFSVAKEVPYGVNLRLEQKTPKEVIEVICQSNELRFTEIGGVYYINTKFDKDNEAAKDFARREKLRLDALLAVGFKRDEALQLMLAKPASPAPVPPAPPAAKPAASARR